MKGFSSIFVAALSLSTVDASVVLSRDESFEALAINSLAESVYHAKRALPNSPSGGYAPAVVECPANRPTIRTASTLSTNETAWLERRRNNTIDPMIQWLTRMNISGFDASAYINRVRNNASELPNIGIGVSGGGYRALMNGAGFIAAADSRTANSTSAGHIGGLLQATTYLAGLSGGGWLVGSIFNNNYSTVTNLRDGSPDSSVWQFGRSIFQGPERGIIATADYFGTIASQVQQKRSAGYNASITDYWGRALSYQLINATDGGPAYTWSSIALADNFRAGDTPMPILVADGRAPGETLISLNSTVYEFNPWEMGSWDPTTYAFAPMEYVGSNFSAGVVPQGGSCVRGFDQSGYVMGTSSSLFNSFLLNINSTAIPNFLRDIFVTILSDLGTSDNDIAQWQPNPFYHFNNDTNRNAQSQQLTLVDGGLDLQNIPLNPLIQPERHVDVIFAIDSSADTIYNWPNGTAIQATYERSTNTTIENGTAFPAIPDRNTFVNLGLNTRPTFFGCDQANITGPTPLIVYIPNAPYIFNSNVSTFNPVTTNEARNLIIQNAYNGATQGNGTLDNKWSTCMACAVLSRSFYKTRTEVPADCTACFQKYCWDGTVNSTQPSGNYTPAYKIGEIEIKSGADSIGVVGAWVIAAALGAAFLLV